MQSLKTLGTSSKDQLKDFYRMCRKRKFIWSIGIYTGESPLALSPKAVSNPVLTSADVTDVKAEFVADPFMLKTQGGWHMFFEVLDKGSNKGKIGWASSQDGHNWSYEKIVLDEPFHLSYPYVFEWENEYYMIPETYEDDSVRLYKATEFPHKWECVKTLIDDECYVDSSIVRFQDYWWLFTSSISWDTLHLYYAKDLMDPWQKHPKSPLITKDKSIARPGGRVVPFHGKLIRYAQDDLNIYGEKVRAFEIETLSLTDYQEKEVIESPILSPAGAGWNAIGMHTIDPHSTDSGEWIACVDGVQHQSLGHWLSAL